MMEKRDYLLIFAAQLTNKRKMKQEDVKRRLESIGRLRLLTATNEEMSQLVGHRVDEKNGLGRLGGRSLFLKRATYDALCRWANARANHDFNEFLDLYEEASTFFAEERMAYLFRHDCETLCSALLDAIFLNKEQRPPLTDQLRIIYNKVYGTSRTRYAADPMLVVLMALGLLPVSFNHGRGRSEDIKEDFRRLFQFLQHHVSRNTMFERLPVLEGCKDRVMHEGHLCARFWLFDDMADILENYYQLMNADQLQTLNSSLREHSLRLDVGGWMWQENETSVWWHWEEVNNGYFLHRTVVDNERQRLLHEKFEAFIFDVQGRVMIHIIHPTAMLAQVEGRPTGRNQTEQLELTWDNDQTPKTLTFGIMQGFHWFRVDALHRTTMSTEAFEKKYAGFTLEELHPETLYDYYIGIDAITPEAIFFQAEDDDGSYFHVPLTLNEALRQVCIDDPAGLMTFHSSNRRFITFTDLNLFLEVTDDASCKRNGITRVREIIKN